MSRIDDLISEFCPDGVEFRALGDVGTFLRGSGLQKKDFVEDGFPCIHYGQIYTFYGTSTTTTKSFITPTLAATLKKAAPGDLVVTTTSENVEDVCTAVAWLGDTDIAIGGHACVFKHSLDPMYAAYYFQTERFEIQKRRFVSGTKVKDIKAADIARIQIPVPPLAVQREIVSILDNMERLQAELQAELNARSCQYEFYRDALLKDARHQSMTLGDIGRVAMCKRIFKHETSSTGEIPFYKIGTFGRTPNSFIEREVFEDYRARFPFPRPGAVLVSASGTIGRVVVYDGRDAYFQDSNIVWLEHDESVVTDAYLRHWYGVIQWGATDGGTIARLYNSNILNATIMVPSLDEQERIVAILDRLDALVNSPSIGLPAEIAARRQQYEYYRDRLLTFPERSDAA
ncbi:restriction endonuclease subunit S [Nocardioides sp. cx-173]|uniref:restriction endonuclease subunit S n=1 Tax=Nocardioides sp. cx-173 TaxID=2898796 RepID=UPI001E42D070|nr:restriction endonuclease subunit S [Nocardioides sp. cx-173]MCD4525126.1 restriction endonuclease subunit S [Nocardioides sp. cx-173]UGB40171.1 restriction endonuclease subunit S [Nocardioides sp. cx-173]